MQQAISDCAATLHMALLGCQFHELTQGDVGVPLRGLCQELFIKREDQSLRLHAIRPRPLLARRITASINFHDLVVGLELVTFLRVEAKRIAHQEQDGIGYWETLIIISLSPFRLLGVSVAKRAGKWGEERRLSPPVPNEGDGKHE